ncbi:Type 1 glutamine amidotransferase-like domain-containing protein [Paenisporosarcina sp. TG20]|uniref:Type 1 glutamine amidotransferase-like domain-containing protein n=1 Tax=Paenisporosarcina sp. TG20 TaxID=1211706 RepID=UPI000363B485|nr:Type 1 glutamine amidotransferase-like domain-containing protein [Paenisporosarcina sp. TG20]
MKNKHLFLFGGSPPFGKHLGRKFADFCCNNKGKVAVLFLERDGWKEYMKKYTSVLETNGLVKFVYLPLSPIPSKSTIEELVSCTGIVIGGGKTELYRDYIVDTDIGKHIKEMYEQGVPVAGFSAGALISPRNCVIPPIDTPKNKHLFLNGLGLISNCVISVHFTKWKEESNLKSALSKTKVSVGYGIDDDVGLYFLNESFSEKEGTGLVTINLEI